LVQKLASISKVDIAFLDGNHRYDPTIKYFNWIKEKSHDHTIIIIDDIHWSKEMNLAWQTIKQDESVSITIDLFELGLVFFKKDIHKQHFVLRL
jgi:predicted O-methyltransferase YrrM